MEENESLMVTTEDNPYDYFDDFDEWYNFDEEKGYHTCGYLARVANTSPSLTDEENQTIINQAVKDIARLNVTGNYIIVRRESSQFE